GDLAAQEVDVDEDAAVDRVGIAQGRVAGEEPGAGEEAGALARVELDLDQLVAEVTLEAVDRGQIRVDERGGRGEQLADRAAAERHLAEEAGGGLLHRLAEGAAPLREQIRILVEVDVLA